MKTLSADKRTDPVARLVRNMTAEEMVDWLITYKGLPESARENVTHNLREQFKCHRLQGRLDQRPTAAVIAEVWGLRHSSRALETPDETRDE